MQVESYFTNKKATATIPAVLEGKKAVLEIETSKYNGVLSARASVATVDGYFKTFRVFGDYNRKVVSEPCSRISAKKVEAMQVKATEPELVDLVVADAIGFYAEKGESFALAS